MRLQKWFIIQNEMSSLGWKRRVFIIGQSTSCHHTIKESTIIIEKRLVFCLKKRWHRWENDNFSGKRDAIIRKTTSSCKESVVVIIIGNDQLPSQGIRIAVEHHLCTGVGGSPGWKWRSTALRVLSQGFSWIFLNFQQLIVIFWALNWIKFFS